MRKEIDWNNGLEVSEEHVSINRDSLLKTKKK